jgi:Ca2+/H+ antiporter
VDTVDVVLGSVSIDEKFLGFTLFALVPNTTEFLNAISFALNGNIALSYLSLLIVLMVVWRLDRHMHYKSVYCRFQR